MCVLIQQSWTRDWRGGQDDRYERSEEVFKVLYNGTCKVTNKVTILSRTRSSNILMIQESSVLSTQ
jgi:hypothetical protein